MCVERAYFVSVTPVPATPTDAGVTEPWTGVILLLVTDSTELSDESVYFQMSSRRRAIRSV